jgi:multidrug efflux pump
MILSDIAVRRPVFAIVMSMVLVLVGLMAFLNLPVRDLPAIEPPLVAIDVTYRGANAQVVENRITTLIEDRISGIEGIANIVSRSRDGRSDIRIEFKPSRDIDDAANDVRDRVQGVIAQLPQEADPPEIRKVDVDAQPILWLNLIHPNMTRMELTDYAQRVLVDRFASIDGVARVQVTGGGRPAMRIWLSRERLAAFNMTPADLEAALRRQNVELPAGRIEGEDTNLSVRVDRAFTSPASFERLVVSRGEQDGYLVRLGDVARISLEPENRYSMFRSNGQPSIGLGIVRQSGANTLEVAQAARAEMERLIPQLPQDMEMAVSFDSSLFIERSIRNVWETLAIAALLVFAVIFLFLGSFRATLIPAITVPISLLATFIVLFLFGYSLNMLTLLAFVLAVGLVVDDAIVVLENIYYRIESGEPPLVAAFEGARQVAFAVVATSVVVCAVFAPLYFIAGQTGALFSELAGAMIGAVVFSTFVALTLIPVLCSKLLRAETDGGTHTRFQRWFDARFARVQRGYRAILQKAVVRPVLVGAVALAVTGGTIAIGTTLDSELAPAEDTGAFFVNVTAAEGTGFDRMSAYMGDLEARLLPQIDEGVVRRMLVRAPASWGVTEDFSSGAMTVFLVPWEERTETTADVQQRFQQVLASDPRVRGNTSSGTLLSRGGGGRPVHLVIAGDTFEELTVARDRIFAAGANIPGLIDLDSDFRETRPQLLVDIDTVRAGDLGVSIADIGTTLETMMGSRRVTTYIDRGEEYYVVLQAEDADRAAPGNLGSVFVRSQTSGQLVPLSNLVTFREAALAGELGRFDKLRSIDLRASLAPGTTLGEALDAVEAIAREQPEVKAIGYKGESRQLRQTGGSLWLVLGFTILLVYLVLAAQFESFIHPGVIILAVPMAVGGGLLGLFLTGGTLNLFSQVGIIILVGLAAKNGILIVEFINQIRDDGVEFGEAVMQGAERRLRPILMTSIATVAGSMPLFLASGAGAGSRRAIGTVIVSGVSVATILTLFVIPTFYAAFARRTTSPEATARRLERERQHAEAAREPAAQPAE